MDNEELVDKVIELYKSGDSPLAQQLIIATTGKKQFRKAEIEFWSKIATLPQLAIFLEIRHTLEGLASVLYLLERLQEEAFLYHTVTSHEITCMNGNYVETIKDFLLQKDVEAALIPKTVRFMTFCGSLDVKMVSVRGNKLYAQIPTISGVEIYLFK